MISFVWTRFWDVVKQFLTEYNLQRELSALSQEKPDTMPGQGMDTSVVEMTDKKLTIDLTPAKKRAKNRSNQEAGDNEEDDEYEPPSSADIQVVHKNPIPNNLHGILKQRTVSESSEDISQEDPSSPRPGAGEGEESLQAAYSKRRSVSFNSYVDKASFKSSAAPSSMTPILKSKRRKQRKHEQRLQNGRNRKNSGGTSSSEECLQVSDSLSHSEEESEGHDGKGRSRVKLLARAASDPGPDSEGVEAERTDGTVGENCEGTKVSSGNKKANGSKSDAPATIASDQDGLDFRTNEKSEVKKAESVVEKGKSSDAEKAAAGLSKEEEKKKKMAAEIKTKLSENDSGSGDGSGKPAVADDSDDDDDDFVDAVSSISEDLTAKLNVKGGGGGGDGGDAQEVREKSDVETMLSWEDAPPPHMNGGEHSTQCAFKFSNSVMFDLDVD